MARLLANVKSDGSASGKLTLSHEIFEMMPFHIVGEVADVDASVLLRVLAHSLHARLLFLLTSLVTSS